jgi:hypothetical protein
LGLSTDAGGSVSKFGRVSIDEDGSYGGEFIEGDVIGWEKDITQKGKGEWLTYYGAEQLNPEEKKPSGKGKSKTEKAKKPKKKTKIIDVTNSESGEVAEERET